LKTLETIKQHTHKRGFLRELTQIFCDDADRIWARFEEAEQHQDWAQLEYLAHRLRGAALNIGADDVAQQCARLESLVNSNRGQAEIHSVLNKISQQLDHARNELRRYVFREKGST
jgi:HPt (histidine-containing phosphotransfer) domain-containing protein